MTVRLDGFAHLPHHRDGRKHEDLISVLLNASAWATGPATQPHGILKKLQDHQSLTFNFFSKQNTSDFMIKK